MSDGSFNPDGNVTRAEMAKMIYAVRMRGNTDAGNFAGLSTSFTDLYDDWYKGYVKWAQSAGIIAGKSATTFDPNGTVTGTEAAKMLLVLAGYTSDKAGLTGANWETNTIKYASQASLLDNMDNVDLSQALSRQYAAQLIYNALFTPMVRWSNDSQSFEELTNKVQSGDAWDQNSITTIGLQYMDLRFFDSIFEGNYQTGAAGREGYVKFVDTDNADNTAIVEYDMDLAWIGEEVTVLYQDNNLRGDTGDLDPDDTIYGVTKTGNTTAYNITKADLKDATAGKIKFSGTNYSAADEIIVYINYVEQDSDTETEGNQPFTAADFDKTTGDVGQFAIKSADTIKFVANEDGEIDKAYIIDKTVSQIVSLTSEKINLRNYGGVVELEGDDLTVDLYDDAAAGDYVYYTEMYENDTVLVVEKAATISGEVTAKKGTDITIDGTTYELSAEDNNTDLAQDITVGDEYDVVLYGNNWVAADAITESADDYAIVVGAEESGIYGLSVKLLKADNTTAVYTVDEDYEAGIDKDSEGVMVAYSVNEEGVAKLYAVDATDGAKDVSYDKATKTLTVDGTGTVTVSGAVAFLKDDNDDWKAYSADTLASQDEVNSIVYTETKSGKIAAFAYDLGTAVAGDGGDDLYGFVLDGATELKDYQTIPVWNGEETVEVRFASDANLDAFEGGEYVKVADFNAEKEYAAGNMMVEIGKNSMADLGDTTAEKSAVTKIESFDLDRNLIVVTDEKVLDEDGTKSVATEKALALADDYKLIGVNHVDTDIYENPVLAEYTDSFGDDYNNVLVVTNSDGEVIVIFIDVDNNIDDNGTGEAATTYTVTDLAATAVASTTNKAEFTVTAEQGIYEENNTVTLTIKLSAAVPEKKKVTVEFTTPTGIADVEIAAGEDTATTTFEITSNVTIAATATEASA